MSSEERMLHDIGIADFVLTDLMLYLDTHPTDRNAMEYFNHYTRIKTQMERESPENITPCGKIWQKVTMSGAGATLPYPGKEDVTDVEL